MEKTKLLTIAVIGLLVINFGTLAFLLLNGKDHRPPQEGRQKPKEIIIKKLRFDDDFLWFLSAFLRRSLTFSVKKQKS